MIKSITEFNHKMKELDGTHHAEPLITPQLINAVRRA